MKLKSIKIKKYYQFSDIELDFTYPSGHIHAGRPLNKACIIGQSGTGKTNLLYLILHASSLGYPRKRILADFPQDGDVEVIYEVATNGYIFEHKAILKNKEFELGYEIIKYNE